MRQSLQNVMNADDLMDVIDKERPALAYIRPIVVGLDSNNRQAIQAPFGGAEKKSWSRRRTGFVRRQEDRIYAVGGDTE
jgi:hypothetical protein